MDAGFTARLVFASVAIGAVLFGLRWILPLVVRARGAASVQRIMHVVESATIAPNTGVYVVRVADRCFLLGGGNGHVTLLTELDAESLAPDARHYNLKKASP